MNLILRHQIFLSCGHGFNYFVVESPSAAVQLFDHSWRDTYAVPSNTRHSEVAVKSFPPDKATLSNIVQAAVLSTFDSRSDSRSIPACRFPPPRPHSRRWLAGAPRSDGGDGQFCLPPSEVHSPRSTMSA